MLLKPDRLYLKRNSLGMKGQKTKNLEAESTMRWKNRKDVSRAYPYEQCTKDFINNTRVQSSRVACSSYSWPI